MKDESCQLHWMVSRLKCKIFLKPVFFFALHPPSTVHTWLWKPKCSFRGAIIRLSSFSRDLWTTFDRQQLGERSAVPPSTGLEAPRQSLELPLQELVGVLIVFEGLRYVSHLSWLTNEVPSDLGVCKKKYFFLSFSFPGTAAEWLVPEPPVNIWRGQLGVLDKSWASAGGAGDTTEGNFPAKIKNMKHSFHLPHHLPPFFF